MPALEQSPELSTKSDYETWLHEVQAILASQDMEIEAWRKNWVYDFRREYEAGMTPQAAAAHAHDFWWRQLMAECWT